MFDQSDGKHTLNVTSLCTCKKGTLQTPTPPKNRGGEGPVGSRELAGGKVKVDSGAGGLEQIWTCPTNSQLHQSDRGATYMYNINNNVQVSGASG